MTAPGWSAEPPSEAGKRWVLYGGAEMTAECDTSGAVYWSDGDVWCEPGRVLFGSRIPSHGELVALRGAEELIEILARGDADNPKWIWQQAAAILRALQEARGE